MKHTESYWAANSIKQVKRPKLEGHKRSDVIIIGGGFTGLSTAYYLSKMGVDVSVIEKQCVGWGASGRNAGMLTTGYKKSIQTLAKQGRMEQAEELLKMSVDCIELVDEIIQEHKINCSIDYSG